jgi:tetratricopeptide (TPR) repeat protein
MTAPSYPGVMVSSTFTDLVEHRKALIAAIDANELKAVGMENDAAKPVDVLTSSLEMVERSAAYIGVVSHKYGWVPADPVRNPNQLSVTELELERALVLGLPMLFFVMHADHPVRKADVEMDPEKIRKLDALRAKVLDMKVCKVFKDLEDFKVAAMQSAGELRRYLEDDADDADDPVVMASNPRDREIPAPPAFYAEPPYIGSHGFLGRAAQLETLNAWAVEADPHPVLLFEAIGGAGKSMLTWEWTNHQAMNVRGDWAGRFWYSFYEKGAVMADFCRRALAYMTQRSFEELLTKKTPELAQMLPKELRARPWLLILDGLERVLVAYHRIDAAQLADEEAGTEDKIAQRDPCAAIRPEDDELLHALASAAPSKLLMTSRLIPRVLLNSASQAIPGVLHERLPGLRPADAEELLRSCGIRGTSQAMQDYLQRHCDCHPLVTGVLAGLINNDYLQDRGNFDAWAGDPDGGAALNLAELDLAQKRNHILRAAIKALPDAGSRLLSTLALLSEGVDYQILAAFNPHAPSTDARRKLKSTVRDLERRGLLQYDASARRYDLHPVVRGVAVGDLLPEQKEQYGQPIVDYFSQQEHSPYDEARSLDDVRSGLHVTRTLIQMRRYQEAFDVLYGPLFTALSFNLQAFSTTLEVIRPFFGESWDTVTADLDLDSVTFLQNEAGIALDSSGNHREAITAYDSAIRLHVELANWVSLRIVITNLSITFLAQNRIAAAFRADGLALALANATGDRESVFRARLSRVFDLAIIGDLREAEAAWALVDPMGRGWARAVYRPGDAESVYAFLRSKAGDLTEEHLARAEELAIGGNNRTIVRELVKLRGGWHIDRNEFGAATDALREAVRMAHEVGQQDHTSETRLALARYRLGQLADPQGVATELSTRCNPAHLPLAELWFAIGDHPQAIKHALEAYKWAWADGEPYVDRFELNRSGALLETLGVAIPDLPPYDESKAEEFAWEDDVRELIEELEAENAKRRSTAAGAAPPPASPTA